MTWNLGGSLFHLFFPLFSRCVIWLVYRQCNFVDYLITNTDQCEVFQKREFNPINPKTHKRLPAHAGPLISHHSNDKLEARA